MDAGLMDRPERTLQVKVSRVRAGTKAGSELFYMVANYIVWITALGFCVVLLAQRLSSSQHER